MCKYNTREHACVVYCCIGVLCLLLCTQHCREKKRRAVMERGRGEGREKDAGVKGVQMKRFEELVFSKYEDEMSGFQEEFSVSIY